MSRATEKCIITTVAVLTGVWCAPFARAADAVTLEAAAGDRDRQGVAVTVELPLSLRGQRHFTLLRLEDSRPIPVQLDPAADARVAWIIRDKLPAGKVRRYRLAPAAGEPAAAGTVSVEDDGKHLLVEVGGKPVLTYNHAVVPSPDPKQPYYRRSGYLHPVFSPSGQVVTDDFNPDHMHQHGIMFAWTKSTFEGRPANCWDQKGGQGKVEHVKVEAIGSGPVFGFFIVRLRHVSLTAPDGPKPMLEETWCVRVYNFSEQFLFDVDSRQSCAGTSPFTVEEYHYGGMMIRGHRAWGGPGGDFLTDEGKTRKDGNHSRPRWCDIHGVLDGQPTGVTIMSDPDNFRFPQHVRLHPSMPYFCFSPAVLGSFTIEPGKPPYVWRYRFYVHDGPLKADVGRRLWQDFAHPPRVRIVADR